MTEAIASPDLQIQLDALNQELEALRTDSILRNVITGIGVLGRDKRMATQVGTLPNLTRDDLDNLFEADHYAAKIIGYSPSFETRKWANYSQRSPNGEVDAEATKAMQAEIDRIAPVFTEARILSRKLGGAAILLGADDGNENYAEPLNEDSLKAIRWWNVHEGGIEGEIQVDQYQDDPKQPDYHQPVIYRLNDSSQTLVHRSRLLLFYGIWPGKRRSRDKYYGWGVPVMYRAYQPLMDYEQSLSAVAIALQDFNKAVAKLKGLVDLISSGQRKKVEQRVQLMEYGSSVLGVKILDPDDEYDILNRSFAGVMEMLNALKSNLGAAADSVVHTKLFNESPAGVTSGSSERGDTNDIVAANQEDHCRPQLDRFIHLLHRCKDGPTKGKVPESYDLEFPPIFQLSELEQADLDLKRSQARKLYVTDMQAVTADEVAEAIARDVPLKDTIDLQRRKEEEEALKFEPEGATTE